MASSNLLPPTRRLFETTIPPSAMTAISDVPPPMSMIMFPVGPLIGTLAPIAAASGSSIRNASLAPGLEGRVADRALLDRRHAGGHADHHLGPREADPALGRLADEEPQHRLGDDVVGDDAVLHRADGLDVAGRAADHLAGLFTHGDDAVVLADRDDGGLGDDDALALDVDDDVRGSEVDSDLHGAVNATPGGATHPWAGGLRGVGLDGVGRGARGPRATVRPCRPNG